MRRIIPAIVTLTLGLALPAATFGAEEEADCGELGNFNGYPLEYGTNIKLVNDSPSVFSEQDMIEAKGQWETCPGLGSTFPGIVLESDDEAGRPVHIQSVAGRNPNANSGCEEVTRTISGSTLVSATITLYTKQSNGTSCNPIDEDIGHAIGHIFGLDDVTTSECAGSLMGTRSAGSTREPASPSECEIAPLGYKIYEPEDPVADLPDLCDRVPELCEDPTGGVPEPWWILPTETAPTCTIVSVCGYGGCQSSRNCYFAKSGLVSRAEETSQGPMTSFQSPADNELVQGTLQIDGWSRDEDLGITGTLGFWVDGQPVSPTGVSYGDSSSAACSGSTDPNCPYVGFSANLDTTQLADGVHTLEVVTAEATLYRPTPGYEETSFRVDNTTPAVQVTSPTSASTVRGTTTVTASASDSSGIEKVRFRVDGEWPPHCVDTTAPYTCAWDTTAYADGLHTMKAQAIDRAGNVNGSASTFTIDNTLPKRYVDRPAHQQVVYGTNVKISGWALDASGIVSYSFALDGSPLPLNGAVASVYRQGVCNTFPEVPDPRCPYVGWRTHFDSTAFSNGGHTLTLTVTDGAGNSRSFQRSFIIDNPPITLEFNPVADAYALQAYPSYNYGSQSYLAVRTTSDGNGAYSFLKFRVTGVEGPVVSAQLKVQPTYYYMNELFLYQLEHSSWSESTLSWNYFPGPVRLLDNRFGLSPGVWYSFDVSAYVNGDGTYSVGFAADNPSYTYLWSRESSYPAVLEVQYEP